MIKKPVALLLGLNMLISPAVGMAAAPTIPGFHGTIPQPAVNTLPQLRGSAPAGVTVNTMEDKNQLDVIQDKDHSRVVIDWSSFDIGAEATVNFKQGYYKDDPTTGKQVWVRDSVALNRIHGSNPTLIYGKLNADGKVYLINQNGILFGAGSQVNVHSLIASTMNLRDTDFRDGLLRFTAENYQSPGYSRPTTEQSIDEYNAALAGNLLLPQPDRQAMVANYGDITTSEGGTVHLIAPWVENGGSIAAPSGKIDLIAAMQGAKGGSATVPDIEITEYPNRSMVLNDVVYRQEIEPGVALNLESGRLTADSGRVYMYGREVWQYGLIRAVSAVKQNGQIFLAATDRVITGPKSLTNVSPSESSEKVSQTFAFSGGDVKLWGLDTIDGTKNTDKKYITVKQPLQTIEHYGAMEAPRGTVELRAVRRVYLETGSSINVGGVWADEPASANLIEAQLNSVQLADTYSQKGGVLQGQNVGTTLQNGSGIGDTSGSYLLGDKTARERSTTGGTIFVGNSENVLDEFIVKQGATLDFSGGGFRYAAGVVPTTKLLSGTTVYDISNAPQSLSYQKILGSQTVYYRKYGVSEEFKGLYTGGGTALNDFAPGRTVGSNAGALNMAARHLVLDGALNGAVTRDQYQTNVTYHKSDDPSDPDNRDYNISVARGLEAPVGGAVQIGNDPGNPGAVESLKYDAAMNEIAVKPTTIPLPAGFSADSALEGTRTELSATILNKAGLSRLGLFANTVFSTEAGARISLVPGGSYTNQSGTRSYISSFTAKARRIEHAGEIDVPGGSVDFMIRDLITSFPTDVSTVNNPPVNSRFVPLTPVLYFAPGSVVSVRGMTVDNSKAGNEAMESVRSGSTLGGRITIQDLTVDGSLKGNNLVAARGALLDVSGGYVIDRAGKITGGDAGSLELKAMNLSLAGDLRGLALPGKNGGQIKLHAGEIVVGPIGATLPGNLPPDAPPSEQLNGRLLLADDRFRDTGFTRIELTAINDITFSSGAVLEPSTARLPTPAPGGAAGPGNGIVPAGTTVDSPDYLGKSSVTATAGTRIYTGQLPWSGVEMPSNVNARVTVASGAVVRTAPGGTSAITLSAPAVDIAGTLASPGGAVTVNATGNPDSGSATDLTIKTGARIEAAGYNKPDTTTAAGRPAGLSPQAGGSVTLTSANGSVVLETGSSVDVSGSAPTERLVMGADGRATGVTAAGAAGSLTLSFDKDLVLDGEIAGRARYAGVQGGTVSVTKTINKNTHGLVIGAGDFVRFQADGFDALTFKSLQSLTLQGAMDVTAGRSLTLDAPQIMGSGRDDVTLRAPWLRLINTGIGNPAQNPAAEGTFSLAGDWIDVVGETSITGFGDVRLAALRDLRLSDLLAGSSKWYGGLETAGDLTLQAARIYPTTASDFTITSHGKVAILSGAISDTTPVYSAGGSLTIISDQGIEHRGLLAAPMGSITLDARPTGRVFLAEGSLTTTSGAASVYYGSLDGTNWNVKSINSSNKGQAVQGAPDKSITLKGDEVVVKEGAQLELAGGGSVYTYRYQTGIEGTANPITVVGVSDLTGRKIRPDRYIILPDNSVQLPGFTYLDEEKQQVVGAVHLEAIRLDNGTYLKEGIYSLLPEQFAFIPGALVISDLGTTVATGAHIRTAEGYQVAGGYGTFLGTGIQSQLLKGYSIRSASDVLKEGNFTVKEYTAGDGGMLASAGNATVLAGSFNAGALPGYKQASLNLSGAVIDVQETVVGLPPMFDFATPLPETMKNRLQLAASSLSGKGVGTMQLGDENTKEITIRQGSVLNAPNVTLAALANDGKVTVEPGAQINAVSETGGGTVSLSAPKGTVDVRAGALVHASNALTLDVSDINLQGDLVTDHGSLNLKADKIFFVPDSYTKGANDKGLFLTEKLWKTFAKYENLGLTSRSDLNFQRDVAMTVSGDLTIDAQKFTGQTSVNLSAGNITLQYSGAAPSAPPAGGGILTLNAVDGIQSRGNIAFDGFGTVNLTSRNDLVLQGAGSLQAPGALNMTAARVTTTFYRDADNVYHAADFTINAGGDISITKGPGTAGSAATPGGNLAIKGKTIKSGAIIEVPSGQVALTATDGISLTDGARILAQGSRQATAADKKTYEYLPGGRIALRSDNGKVDLQSGSLLDVSGADKGESGSLRGSLDAGAISLAAPKGVVTTAGDLRGAAGADAGTNGVAGRPGKGGSLTLDTNSSTLDLSALNQKITDGGFTERLDIRARQGNLNVPDISAHEIVLSADDGSVGNGKIDVTGKVTALADSKGIGGRVELYAQNDLTVTGSILAKGAVSGGEIFLGSESASGMVKLMGTLDVSGGKGGLVNLRAQRNSTNGVNGVNMALNGTITGASQVVAEAFKVYSYPDPLDLNNPTNYTINSIDISSWYTDASNYLNSFGSTAMPTGIGWNAVNNFRPGIEIRSSGDITLPSTIKMPSTGTAGYWDLTNERYVANDEPGVLTLRAAGNLGINANLVDHPTSYTTLHSGDTTIQNSWGINLAAGADLNGASPLAVKVGQLASTTGNLVLGPLNVNTGRLDIDASGNAKSGTLVYTENAPIRFTAGNNTDIGYGVAGGYMINTTILYNIGAYGGTVRGETGGDLTIRAGAIQSAVGDIDLHVRGDLNLYNRKDSSGTSSIGTIRTTGEYVSMPTLKIPHSSDPTNVRPSTYSDYWTYQGGGDITLDVAGNVAGSVNKNYDSSKGKSNGWDATYNGKTGVNLTGNNYLTASYDGTDATEGIATMAGGSVTVRAGKGFTSQIGTFGAGDLTIFSGGDLNGRYRIGTGAGRILAMGSFGSTGNRQVLELGAAEVSRSDVTVAAMGDLTVGGVLNPYNNRIGAIKPTTTWDFTFSSDTSVSLISLTGSVNLYDKLSNTNKYFDGYGLGSGLDSYIQRTRILPPVVEIIAAENLLLQGAFALSPAPRGNLRLVAGNDIIGNSNQIAMVDIPTDSVYGWRTISGNTDFASKFFSLDKNNATVLHQGDPDKVEVRSRRDILNLTVYLDKPAEIHAGRDIKELIYYGQNLVPEDTTTIRADRDILYDSSKSGLSRGIRQGGPGALLVQAGRNIDLGNAFFGILSVGNQYAPLGDIGSDLIVVVGAGRDLQPTDARVFFNGVDGKTDHTDESRNGIREAGIEYSDMLARGDTAAARQRIEQARTGIIKALFDDPPLDGSGSLVMVNSRIGSDFTSARGNIYLLVRGGLDVGKSVISYKKPDEDKGIYTYKGGAINIYTGGEANINESRVQTLLGGDITIWSDRGNINAGRGSRTAVTPPTKNDDGSFKPPSIGSGIRAVTFDPNLTPGGGLPIPDPGDLYLFAPQGVIDAGEAGMAGGKVVLGATEVLNAKNISFSAGSVGVPSASEGGVSLGSLVGAGSVAESSKMIEQTSGLGAAKDKTAASTKAVDDFMSKWLDVKIISFDTDEESADKDKMEKEEQMKKEKK
ncbi:MAG: filamentous hemagglutinin family outer membrane [Geobacteraceae bacterium]|nr:MAG: filamentous hemagglutinin family outer membrane [Geobacteraceae bacterium]